MISALRPALFWPLLLASPERVLRLSDEVGSPVPWLEPLFSFVPEVENLLPGRDTTKPGVKLLESLFKTSCWSIAAWFL